MTYILKSIHLNISETFDILFPWIIIYFVGFVKIDSETKKRKQNQTGSRVPFCLQCHCTTFVKRGLNPRRHWRTTKRLPVLLQPLLLHLKTELFVTLCNMGQPL